MHDINYFHEHELKEHDFLGCCKDCQGSLNIIKPHIPVIYRTYTGMRAVLYAPVSEDDVKDFRTVKKVFPTGRVNNTTVFAELAK
jgi:hypothetical protein